MKKQTFYLMLPVFWLMAACDKPEPVPAYLQIDPFVVEEKGGAGWQAITEGWLYVNNEFLGAYTLPATIPVLAEGEADIVVFPGVKENGIASTPNLYLFMKRYEVTLNLTPPESAAIKPKTEYETDLVIPWGERGDFDGSSDLQLVNRDGDDSTGFVLTTSGAFAGKSLLMAADTAHPFMEIVTEQVNLPTTAEREVWLELHHKNDMPFALNLVSGETGVEFIQAVYLFNDAEEWNKIYINLTEFLIASLQEKHRLDFRVSLPKDTKGQYTQKNGKVLLDNIRLVHF